MTGAAGPVAGPSIRIGLRRGAPPRLEQRRPQALRALIGRSAREALAVVPLLTPICGAAQGVAALRAIESAADRPAGPDVERWRDIGLRAEQAVSIAWRLAIDWPALAGAPADPGAVREIRRSAAPLADAGRAVAAGEATPSAAAQDGALAEAVDATAARLGALARVVAEEDLDAVLAAVSACSHARPDPKHDAGLDAGAGAVAVAAVLARALEAPATLGVHGGRRPPVADLVEIAAATLTAPRFDALAPGSSAVEVGPFASTGDPVVAAAEARFGPGVFARLLAGARAALRWGADARQALHGPDPPPGAAAPSATGVGAALTARGPLLHWIALDRAQAPDPIIADWRVLAPTDWHFASNGPVVRAVDAVVSVDLKQSDAALCVAGFDPCAPCVVEMDDHA